MRWLVLAMLMAVGCGGTAAGGGDDEPPPDGGPTGNGTVFEPMITDVVVEIDFETGQEPFTGAMIGGEDTFELSHVNIDRLFGGRKALTLPRTLAEMEDVGTIADEELTVSDLLALAQQHRDNQDGGAVKTYYILFVSGHFATAEGPRPTVLGVSIGSTGVIAMFKDVIRSTNNPLLPNVVRFVEQATIIHELGHAFGLTNNGVPMVTPHQDTEHGAHCDDDACVMYYLNEGASDATAFVTERVLGGDSILFDANCLADADALTGGPR
jgi:hypothetical protein